MDTLQIRYLNKKQLDLEEVDMEEETILNIKKRIHEKDPAIEVEDMILVIDDDNLGDTPPDKIDYQEILQNKALADKETLSYYSILSGMELLLLVVPGGRKSIRIEACRVYVNYTAEHHLFTIMCNVHEYTINDMLALLIEQHRKELPRNITNEMCQLRLLKSDKENEANGNEPNPMMEDKNKLMAEYDIGDKTTLELIVVGGRLSVQSDVTQATAEPPTRNPTTVTEKNDDKDQESSSCSCSIL
ncbi:hypothetical protein RFI_11026 [Reticulomyxa filosa]|uniref:Ubiquitin-like domain-containing protein n=1 Tax=Reticulomyxa filosa TaxID=46433 RepID=X6NL47_RETFI|nr:hypothetical protein RFI_11026 [Reticulomyxa filosa]|eukprot:ETO26112.1 hypothetical protein RFI_11026 [Reticulomyxa filosa]